MLHDRQICYHLLQMFILATFIPNICHTTYTFEIVLHVVPCPGYLHTQHLAYNLHVLKKQSSMSG